MPCYSLLSYYPGSGSLPMRGVLPTVRATRTGGSGRLHKLIRWIILFLTLSGIPISIFISRLTMHSHSLTWHGYPGTRLYYRWYGVPKPPSRRVNRNK